MFVSFARRLTFGFGCIVSLSTATWLNAQEDPKPDATKIELKEEPVAEKKDEPSKEEAAKQSEKKENAEKSAKADRPSDEPNNTSVKTAERKAERDAKPKENKTSATTASPAKPEKVPLPKLGMNSTNMIPGMPWRIHDLKRPRPKAIKPGNVDTAPPADARILFGGQDLSEWYHPGKPGEEDEIFEPQWKVHDGYFEIEPRSGSILTIDGFASCQLHIEWMIPEGTTGTSQGRGNSGVKFMERYEVQILDSFNNRTYADGQAAAIYGQYPPLVNASREQGQWQTYDIVFEAPKFEESKMVQPPIVTVFHNGLVVQHRRELTGPTGLRNNPAEVVPPAAPIMLQDHGNRIRFRNIWIREL